MSLVPSRDLGSRKGAVMRSASVFGSGLSLILLFAPVGCTFDWNALTDNAGATSGNNSNTNSDGDSSAVQPAVLGALQTAFTADNSANVRGSVRQSGEYQLFD